MKDEDLVRDVALASAVHERGRVAFEEMEQMSAAIEPTDLVKRARLLFTMRHEPELVEDATLRELLARRAAARGLDDQVDQLLRSPLEAPAGVVFRPASEAVPKRVDDQARLMGEQVDRAPRSRRQVRVDEEEL